MEDPDSGTDAGDAHTEADCDEMMDTCVADASVPVYVGGSSQTQQTVDQNKQRE